MYVSSIKGSEEEIFKLACKEEITVYDASYLYLAKVKDLILVTDDKKIKRKSFKIHQNINKQRYRKNIQIP